MATYGEIMHILELKLARIRSIFGEKRMNTGKSVLTIL